MERTKYQYEGIKWLMEMELLNDPQAINTVKLNVMMASDRIKEVEILIHRENKSMLVLLELTWVGRKFLRKRIFGDVHDILSQLLPTFQFRVIDDPKIMQLSVERVKQALSGGKYENSSSASNNVHVPTHEQPLVESAAVETSEGSSKADESDLEKQSKAINELLSELSSGDPKKE